MWTSYKYKRDTCSREPSDCIECQDFIDGCCIGKEQKDAPRGWIRLKVLGNVLYINVSKIVALKPMKQPSDETGTKVYTVNAEHGPWRVDESIDEIIAKIEKA